MKRASLLAVDERHDRLFSCIAALADFAGPRRAAADECFVSLYGLLKAAHLRSEIRLAHRFADAMHQEPRRFQADAKHPVQLMRAHSLFRRGKQVHRLEPDMEPDLAALHDGPDRNGELLAAGVALEEAGRDASLPTIRVTPSPKEPQCGQTGPFGQMRASNHSRAKSSS